MNIENDDEPVFHLSRDGKSLGDYPLSWVKAAVRDGTLLATDTAKTEGRVTSVSLSKIEELQPAFVELALAEAERNRGKSGETQRGAVVKSDGPVSNEVPKSAQALNVIVGFSIIGGFGCILFAIIMALKSKPYAEIFWIWGAGALVEAAILAALSSITTSLHRMAYSKLK